MPISKPLIAVAAIVLYVLFLLATLPAQQIIPRLSLPNTVAISGVSGTIWNGNASSVYANGIRIYNLDWSVSPWALLVGNLTAELKGGSRRQADQVAIAGQFTLSTNHIAAQDAQIFIPTDMVIANLPIPLPVNASGRFKVDLEEARYSQQCEQLQATGEWLNSGVMGTAGNIPLGNFKADLMCESGNIQIKVTPPNQLGLEAIANVAKSGSISVQGKFRVAPELPKEVHDAARFFGNPDAQGFYQINF
ncbi:MAG: type II secretion system protein N [Aestuariibacter sp.]